jgi:hypothetical protein
MKKIMGIVKSLVSREWGGSTLAFFGGFRKHIMQCKRMISIGSLA